EPTARLRHGHRHHLVLDAAAPALLEPAVALQERAVLEHRTPQLIDALAADRLGLDDRRLPWPVAVEREDRADLAAHGARGRMAASGHRADEHPGVEEVVAEPDPVAEHGPVREGAGWVDRDHADGFLVAAKQRHQR